MYYSHSQVTYCSFFFASSEHFRLEAERYKSLHLAKSSKIVCTGGRLPPALSQIISTREKTRQQVWCLAWPYLVILKGVGIYLVIPTRLQPHLAQLYSRGGADERPRHPTSSLKTNLVFLGISVLWCAEPFRTRAPDVTGVFKWAPGQSYSRPHKKKRDL
jgi:hypothetical protein